MKAHLAAAFQTRLRTEAIVYYVIKFVVRLSKVERRFLLRTTASIISSKYQGLSLCILNHSLATTELARIVTLTSNESYFRARFTVPLNESCFERGNNFCNIRSYQTLAEDASIMTTN